MRTQKEIKAYLKGKTLDRVTKNLITGYLYGKSHNLSRAMRDVNMSDNIYTDIDFLPFVEWFESKPKEENQNIITFEGKEYEFIESTWGNCCKNCDLMDTNMCKLSQFACCSVSRNDNKDGYFKLIKPKELELIPNEFYYSQYGKYSWVIQFKEFIVDDFTPISYYYMLEIHNNTLNHSWRCKHNGWVKATPAQKQQLIDKIKQETDKVWNEGTKMFEDKPKDILVPENIKIAYFEGVTYDLGILFNNNKQILNIDYITKDYLVSLFDDLWKITPCKLIPTLFSEIKAGNIYIECGLNQLNPSCYHIKLQGKEYVKIDGKKDIQVSSDLPDKNQNVLKVVPII